MRIAVIGGTGLIGSKLINKLREMSHDAVALPAAGLNPASGEELRRALVDTRVVVDVANTPSVEAGDATPCLKTPTAELIAAGTGAGIAHYVALCVAGLEQLPENLHRAAHEVQKDLINGSHIPYTILQSTQLFELVGSIAARLSDGRAIHAAPAHIRPIGSDDVVTTLAEIAVGKPMNGIVEIAGPQQFHLDDLLRHLLQATADLRVVVSDRASHSGGASLAERSSIPAEVIGMTRFADWVAYFTGYAPMPTPLPSQWCRTEISSDEHR